jgi:hypothetical protein
MQPSGELQAPSQTQAVLPRECVPCQYISLNILAWNFSDWGLHKLRLETETDPLNITKTVQSLLMAHVVLVDGVCVTHTPSTMTEQFLQV